MIAAGVNGSALLKMFYSSMLAGIGSATVFAVALFGATRASDMRRANRSGAATAYAALAAVGFIVVGAVVVYGLILVAHK